MKTSFLVLFGPAMMPTTEVRTKLSATSGTTLIVACTVGTEAYTGLHVFMSLTLIGLTATTFVLVCTLYEFAFYP